MNHIIFQNSGELDLLAVSTFGCSVKQSNNPIGFFGTGLKYALAVLLRLNHKVIIQSGINALTVTLSQRTVRGQVFSLVRMGDTDLGFTTELGKTWQAWMAYRELFCNAKDEPASKVYESSKIPAPQSGITRIIVTGDDILNAHRHVDDFILKGEPTHQLYDIAIVPVRSKSFFYKGIKVLEFTKPCLFTYNHTTHLDLTEDRTVKEPFAVSLKIARNLLACKDRLVLEKVLLAPVDSQESGFDFHWTGLTPSLEFIETVAHLTRSSLVKVNPSAVRMWREKCGGVLAPREIEPTKIQAVVLERAISFCVKSGFPLRGEYPIKIVESLGATSTLAIADRVAKVIYLTQDLFDSQGTKGVASALIEEYLHLRYGLEDESRSMQNFLFNKLISFAEALSGEPL